MVYRYNSSLNFHALIGKVAVNALFIELELLPGNEHPNVPVCTVKYCLYIEHK